ncbi:type IV pilus biogenesis and competence protein PilQ precursor [bacterium BMS3Bbin11]|nr:type IV pilus biogenesis and competence protein PilQ precursor [bacterium BMS3Abin11]GBE45368.1 type IV pilus biogenesis and competence protein PilQ precursor [bacterium BMS3Bbin11]
MKMTSHMKHKNQAGTVALLTGLLFTPGIEAAELSALHWKSSLGEDAVIATVDERVKVKTSELDGGKRLRVSFPATSMVADLKPLLGKGLVKSVEAVKDNKSVQIDLVTSIPAHISVISIPGGYRISTEPAVSTAPIAESGPTVIPLAMTSDITGAATATVEPAEVEPTNTMPSSGAAVTENSIKQITFSRISGGRVQVNIQMDARPDEPAIFVTKNPSRIAMDFFSTRNGLGKNTLNASEGVLHSINAVEVADRTRVILNLDRNTAYQTEITDSGLTLILDPEAVKAASRTAAKQMKFSGSLVENKVHKIEGIDFRRGPQGEGNITVTLSDPEVGIDIDDEKGQVVIDFNKTAIHEDLERRLDVMDFATPIRTIDTFREGKGTRMVISVNGDYDQIAYQTGNTFTVSVRKLTKNELKVEDEFGYSGERLSLNFQKIDVRSALQVIADFTGLNIVTSDTVKGSLTLRLQDVPWDQALDLILKTKGLAKREKGNVFWIAPAKEIAAREKAELEALKKTRELEPLISELIEINYASAKDIAKLLKSIKAIEGPFTNNSQGNPFSSVSVSEIPTESNSLLSERGSVTVDERTNTLLIQDTPSKIREVKKLISKLDQPVKQVLIETRIVEARDGYSRTLGVRLGITNLNKNFNLGNSNNSAGEAIASGTIDSATAAGSSFDTNGDFQVATDGLNVDLGSTGLGNFLASTVAFTLAKFADGYGQVLGIELQALQAEGNGKLISSPRLITANNKEAHIEQGQERIFTTNVLGVGSVVTKKAVLGLRVTPHITPDNRIIMDVFITKDSFTSPTEPTIDKKEIQTQILLDHGETAVIGGIYQQTLGKDVTKVPLLGDLPVIGVLFRNKQIVDNKTELLIFLTPKIITPSFGLLGS